ncbi:hypothetical protein bcgnr5378_04850 [Bacillus cereus]
MDYVGNRKVISGVLLKFFLIIFEKVILRGGGVDFLGVHMKKELTYFKTVSSFLKFAVIYRKIQLSLRLFLLSPF